MVSATEAWSVRPRTYRSGMCAPGARTRFFLLTAAAAVIGIVPDVRHCPVALQIHYICDTLNPAV
jgi:hypothetical protein